MEDSDESPILATAESSLLPKEDDNMADVTSNPHTVDNKFSDNFKGSLIHAQEGIY